MIRAVPRGVGKGVPSKVVTNADLVHIVETSDEWIVQRTGIRERRICEPHETTGGLSLVAARQALDRAGWDPASLDLIVVGTVSGEWRWPATACYLQAELGAFDAFAYDLAAACAGFAYAVDNAAALIESGRARRALVVGADCLSKHVDWTDRNTCVLFGDGAGAMLLEAVPDSDRGVLASVLKADGRGACHIWMEAGGSRFPGPDAEHKEAITMNGKEVYRFAVNAMPDACLAVLNKAGMTPDQVDLFVPHQANIRIIRAAQERMGLTDDRVFVNVDRYGNTSAGSIPLALAEADEQGLLTPGKIVLTVGFGAGLTWGANLIRW